jgi:hypothetical protein
LMSEPTALAIVWTSGSNYIGRWSVRVALP